MKDTDSKKPHTPYETAAFERYMNSCTQNKRALLSGFFKKLASRIDLTEHETCAMKQDYQKAVLYYHSRGYPLDKTLQIIGLDNIGDFYSRKPMEWYPLDNAAARALG